MHIFTLGEPEQETLNEKAREREREREREGGMERESDKYSLTITHTHTHTITHTHTDTRKHKHTHTHTGSHTGLYTRVVAEIANDAMCLRAGSHRLRPRHVPANHRRAQGLWLQPLPRRGAAEEGSSSADRCGGGGRRLRGRVRRRVLGAFARRRRPARVGLHFPA